MSSAFSASAVNALRPALSSRAQAGGGAIEHDPEWLRLQCDRADKTVMVLSDNEERLVPFFVHDGEIDLALGELSLGSIKVRRHVLVGNFPEQSLPAWEPIFLALRDRLDRAAAVFLLGVVKDEPLHRILFHPEVRNAYFLLRHGAPYLRRLCRLEGSLEAYLATLPAKSRQDLRRSQRRFEAQFGAAVEFHAFSDPLEVDGFMGMIESASSKTYQARLLGLGISRSGYIGNKVMHGARLGYARCFLLSVDGRPVAWRVGLLYRGVYFSHHIGYDPEFERWHPGVVTHLYSIRDLTERCAGVHTMDMLYGDNDFKRKASNASREECNYYMFPRTLRGAATYGALAASNGLSEFAGKVLSHWGLKARLKAWIRRT